MSPLLLCPRPHNPLKSHKTAFQEKPISPLKPPIIVFSRRLSIIIFATTSQGSQIPLSSAAETPSPLPSTSFLSGTANTKSWFQFYGDGFAIWVPPQLEVIMMEPEDYNARLSLYGDKAKPRTRLLLHDLRLLMDPKF